MSEKREYVQERPTSDQIERELRRRELTGEAHKTIIRAAKTLIVFAAVAVLIVTLLFPTIQVQRGSMSPTLRDGEQLILISVGNIKRGDIIAFHLGSQTMIKRVIAVAGEWIDISENGTVQIDGTILEEPYLVAQLTGESDIELPFQVPDNHYFVMGDNRAISMDSRISDFGTVHQDEVIGKTVLRIWPLNKIGFVL